MVPRVSGARRRLPPRRAGLLWTCGLVTTAAFDIDAHDAIGQTAASAMDQQAVKQVKRLLGGQDASDVAGWGHQVDDTFPDMARLHFQVHDDSAQPFCGPAESRVANCEDNVCLLAAIKHFYGKVLQDEGRRIDYPSIDYNKVAKGIKFSDADSVKMLINLVGDLHQPMHVGFKGDDNGKKVQINFRGQMMSLYDVWDKGISEAVRTQESSFWLGGWTHIRAISDEFEKDKALWQKEGPFKSFERWAAETISFACEKAYAHPTTGQKLGGPGVGQNPIAIDDAAYQAWREAWLRQLLIAGERTAIVLNDILDAGGAAKLHEGTSVKTKADDEKEKEKKQWEKERNEIRKSERAARGSPHINFSVLLTNLSIAAVVVPLFLVVANYGLNPRVYAALLRTLTESGGGTTGGGPGQRSAKRFE
mmetsp:Transcript_45513/g.131845  ORF Transcript_45513/g.131845 Transcript_45513/m.131845 type:complete len:420 (+) Transcript_45513:106-1365(+)